MLRVNGAQQRQITTETDYGATAEELVVCIKKSISLILSS